MRPKSISYASVYSIDMIMNALNKLDYLNMLFEAPYIHPFRNKIKSIEDKALHKKIVSYFHGDVSKDISSVFELWDHLYITSAKRLGGWGKAIF